MKTLIYQAAAGHQLLENGQAILAGDPFEASDDRAAELLADPLVPIAEAQAGLEDLKRPELDRIAAEAGIDDPKKLPNKAAVIAAITQREADIGEAQPTEGDQ